MQTVVRKSMYRMYTNNLVLSKFTLTMDVQLLFVNQYHDVLDKPSLDNVKSLRNLLKNKDAVSAICSMGKNDLIIASLLTLISNG